MEMKALPAPRPGYKRCADIDPFWIRWGKFVEERKPAKKGKR